MDPPLLLEKEGVYINVEKRGKETNIKEGEVACECARESHP